jgi:Excreted virulence factor EspC, type VII ESX diderm
MGEIAVQPPSQLEAAAKIRQIGNDLLGHVGAGQRVASDAAAGTGNAGTGAVVNSFFDRLHSTMTAIAAHHNALASGLIDAADLYQTADHASATPFGGGSR